ncbi:MAG: DUF1501 domain-containing protein [Mariniblastus sp.]|nr:DUF1501 domain-containing protein [Mariniblastus sp.]
MNLENQKVLFDTRRHFLKKCPIGLGGIYLASQMSGVGGMASASDVDDVVNPIAQKNPHFAAKAKNVIYIHLAGSPPTLDLFDYKPELVKRTGEDCPDEFLAGRRFAFTSGKPKLLGTPRQFKQHGEGGVWMSDALPTLPEVADEMCVIRSMNTDQFNHAPAQLFLLTGSPRQGRPSFGSWVTYGLGSENEDLPGFVVLNSGGTNPSAGKNAWGNGFLPSVFQGVQCRSKGAPVLYVNNPAGMSRQLRRKTLDAINELNSLQAESLGSPETRTRIAQYELAYRMQVSVPQVMNINDESKETIESYGAKPGEANFANNCLLARRLVEQGVRFVQLFDWGWDFHGTNASRGLKGGLSSKCASMDRPVTALIKDLKQRGMLQDTLVIWGGEFGRTPFREGRTAKSQVLGRDHYPDCYSIFMAGGGVKGGYTHGETDELGFKVASDGVHVHDYQATVLHLLGMDHERLTHRFQGRDYRLTDVHGEVVHDIIA